MAKLFAWPIFHIFLLLLMTSYNVNNKVKNDSTKAGGKQDCSKRF